MNGNASSTIDVGSTYVDLGASVTDDHDQNLGIHFFVNGSEVQEIQLDTSTTSTYSIEYRATDTGGLTGSAMRTVTVADSANDNPPPAANDNSSPATTTIATSTSP